MKTLCRNHDSTEKTVQKSKTMLLCRTAALTAIIFAVTRIIQIPIPLGYLNIGNAVILFSCLLLPKTYGIFAGSIGSAIADLTSFPAYTIPTLIIKALMPLVFYLVHGKNKEKKAFRIIAAAIATLIPLVGYTITGMLLYGSFYMGLSQLPGLLVEYAGNLVLFVVSERLLAIHRF